MAFLVFVDTCVLFGQTVNNLILSLAEHGCFAPRWSKEVLDALERNVGAQGRATAKAIHHRRVRMERAFPEAMIDGFDALVERMTNHPGDRHVLAACVVSQARTLVTFNLKDFPEEALQPYDIEAIDPDAFVLDQLDLHPLWSRLAVESMLRANEHPPQDFVALAHELRKADMPQSAAAIETWS
ncbi:PIN domain-containing protein [Propioniciclava flava]